MKTGQTQGLLKPSLVRTIFWVVYCMAFIAQSMHVLYRNHTYHPLSFMCDLAFLSIIGYEITSYRTRLYKWKFRKQWEDKLRNDSE